MAKHYNQWNPPGYTNRPMDPILIVGGTRVKLPPNSFIPPPHWHRETLWERMKRHQYLGVRDPKDL